jgi:uncharacterized membrane protein
MANSQQLTPIEELLKLRKPLLNTLEEHTKRLSELDRLALSITRRVGTMGFFLIIFVWTVLWLAWNTYGPLELRFDPFPAFVLWLFIANVIQILLMPLIMVGQNLESRHAEIRAKDDYEINKKAEREVEAILTHLEYQSDLLDKIYQKLK